MSVMNGFRAELLDKIVGLEWPCDRSRPMAAGLTIGKVFLPQVRETEGVTDASPLIEQPLLTQLWRTGGARYLRARQC